MSQAASIAVRAFGRTPDGQQSELYVLRLPDGSGVSICDFGARIVEWRALDRQGRVEDIVLGFDTVEGYVAARHSYIGGVVGRYAGRIAGARFELDGRLHLLTANEGPNQLHGGPRGFDQVPWSASAGATGAGAGVTLRLVSPDGDGGFPGALDCTVVYELAPGPELRVTYAATTDAPTVVNLTQHAYFNLAGGGSIADHELRVPAGRFACLAPGCIPTGELRSVEGTPFDLRAGAVLGEALEQPDAQLAAGAGFDHSFVLDAPAGTLRFAALLRHPPSGRRLEVLTTEPALHLYTGNYLYTGNVEDQGLVGKGGRPMTPRTGLCLETQHLPDSPNRPDFPSTVLRPGQSFQSTTIFRCSVE